MKTRVIQLKEGQDRAGARNLRTAIVVGGGGAAPASRGALELLAHVWKDVRAVVVSLGCPGSPWSRSTPIAPGWRARCASRPSRGRSTPASCNPYPATPPGRYISMARVITGRQRDDGHFTFQIALSGGITPVDGGRVYEKSDKYPLTDRKVSTQPFQDGDRGITSGAAKYLRACGVTTKGLKPVDIPGLMQESQLTPVGVVIGRTVKAVDTDDGWETPFIHRDGSGVTYATVYNPDKKTLREVRTSDFRDADGNVTNTYTDANGRVWESKATVEGYFLLK